MSHDGVITGMGGLHLRQYANHKKLEKADSCLFEGWQCLCLASCKHARQMGEEDTIWLGMEKSYLQDQSA